MPNKHVIGVSATSFSANMSFEQDFLEWQGFKCYNSNIRGYIDPFTATKSASIDDFLRKSAGYAKLVFAQGEDEATFRDSITQEVNETNCQDLARL